MRSKRFAFLSAALGITAHLVACGSSSSGGAGDNDASVTGAGGSNAGAGGSTATGGAPGTGGVPGGGGTPSAGTGGAPGTGGAVGVGGAPGTGGTVGTGGAPGSGGAAGATGSGGARDAGGTGTGGAGGVRDAGGATPDGGNPGGGVSVLQHHNNPSRDGLYIDARLTRAAAATMHFDTTFTRPTVTGPTFAQPLYLAGTAGRPDLVIVATEQDHVLAYNAATGGAPVWDRSLGTPVPRSALPCGNFTPVGVTGTPIIDSATRTLYVDAMITGAGGVPKHQVFSINADTGVVNTGWPADLDSTATFGALAFTSSIQNQRGALGLLGGRVFVPFGGHVGDCQMYHGWVVGVTTTNPAQVSGWATRGFGGGIWGPGGIASDGTSIFVTTGNTMGQVNNPFSAPAAYSDGESLFRLPPSLTFSGQNADFFEPANWSALDMADADLGGSGPILVNVGGASLVVTLDKNGHAFILNKANLGAVSPPVVDATVSSSTIITAAATYTTSGGTFVVFKGNGVGCPAMQSGGLTAFRVTATTATVAWCGGPGTNGSPIVSATNAQGTDAVVWITGSDGLLHGLNGDTGASIFAGGGATMAGIQSFQTPIVVNGRVFAVGNQLYAFTIN
jgi:hypothetical protein